MKNNEISIILGSKIPVHNSGWRTMEKSLSSLRCTGHSDEPPKAKIVSAKASTIFESYLHGAKVVSPNFSPLFVSRCYALEFLT